MAVSDGMSADEKHAKTLGNWSQFSDSNRGPTVYKTVYAPFGLFGIFTIFRFLAGIGHIFVSEGCSRFQVLPPLVSDFRYRMAWRGMGLDQGSFCGLVMFGAPTFWMPAVGIEALGGAGETVHAQI